MYDEDYWKRYEERINKDLCERYDVSIDKATDIINMMRSMFITRGAALEHINIYLSNHERPS